MNPNHKTTEAGLEAAAKLRETLKNHPTPGPWRYQDMASASMVQAFGYSHLVGCEAWSPVAHCLARESDAWFIAAANPGAIRTVLDALDSSIAREAATRAEMETLRAAGALMANTMFNLAQHPGRVLTDAECATFKSMQVKWDAACSELATTPTSTLKG